MAKTLFSPPATKKKALETFPSIDNQKTTKEEGSTSKKKDKTAVTTGVAVFKRYTDGWYQGEIKTLPPQPPHWSATNSNNNNKKKQSDLYVIHYEDGMDDYMSDDEVKAGMLAYDILQNKKNAVRPPVGHL